MLSKIRTSRSSVAAPAAPPASPFGPNVVLEPVGGGTLGLCYQTVLDGERRFLKTHGGLVGARENLAKEIALLTSLDGTELHVRSYVMADGRLWLTMDGLSPAIDPTPAQVAELVAAYAFKLAALPDKNLVALADRFSMLLVEAGRAFAELASQQMIGVAFQRAYPEYLALLRRMELQTPACICHGDLSPCNIMTNGARLFAVDWEDAFWALEGYDYLYWLTFFENRRHYGPAMFGRTPWGKDAELAVLLTVLVIKCGLSLRDKSYFGNRLTFDQRLMEVLAYA